MTDSNQQAGPDAIAALWPSDLRNLIEKFQLPGIDLEAVIDWQRKDIEALTEANRQAYEGIRALVERRNVILSETLKQWQAAVQNNAGAELVSKQAEAAKQGLEKAVSNFRELIELEAQARNGAWNVVQDRMRENLVNLQKLLQPK